MSFFKHLPIISYNGQQARNLLARAKLSPESKKNLSLYYPYTLKESDGRAEVLSKLYYDDPHSVWMIYFANDVVDPYFDLGLSQQDFEKFIVAKYGSIQLAQQKIAFYRTNWELLEDSTVTTSYYDALSAGEKKYWKPVLDVYGAINSYERKKEDLIMNTNRIFELTIEDAGEFTLGEKVYSNSSVYGFCTFSNSSTMIVQSTTGMNTSNFSSVTGFESSATAEVTDVVLINENISANVEATYWKAVSYYENEEEINSLKKNIELIDKRFKNKIEDELKKTMRS